MYIAIIYSIIDKKSQIIYISNNELEAIDSLMDKSAKLSTDEEKNYKVNVIDKRTIHVYHHDVGYLSTSVKLSHILEILEYDGELIPYSVVDTEDEIKSS
jgi:hypothetical protein